MTRTADSRRPQARRQRRAMPCLLLALAVAAAGLAAAPARAATMPEAVPGEIVVKLKATAALPALLTRYRLTLAAQFGARPIYRLRVAAGADVRQLLAALALEPAVQLAEPNLIHRSPEARKNQAWAIGEASAYTAQWAPQALRWPLAHTRSRGTGVCVAVLDTGVDATHPTLAGRVLPGADLVDGDLLPAEGAPTGAGYGHGTHVAGLVLAGAPQATILPLRVLDDEGAGNVWVLAEALLRAVDPDGNPATRDGAQVINLSLGTLTRTRLLDAVGTLATCATPEPGNRIEDQSDPGYGVDRQRCANGGGAIIVAAAGNDASGSIREYPAAEGVYGLLSVTASTPARRVASFANSGNWIDVAAPGEGLTSTLPGGLYATWSGTSMAAAVASASAALLRSAEPALTPRDSVRRLMRSAVLLCDGRTRQIDAAATLGLGTAVPVACP
ncbi:MAG: S8 family serine peptidase [Burkholderiaceae bacterium]|nr:S8 family serine peptidase [Burkholderiaceae bacterium]